ncbi:hypothetical protein FNT36_18325 [Hymenobacter setariae]|uniref:Uncharacterized protein n=1 Tax=Hymenobacter setariae TaxID=2594794 RepID=A0A558BSY8_9BACT|nr:hypothetical protein [Hymenobacter setariae]TVT39599.1 hypothetical protein FNT36_18325 [Hymenobacter setariae]
MTVLFSALISIAISWYWALAVVVIAAVSFAALLNCLFTWVFLGNRIKLMFWLMVAGTVVGAIAIGLDALL